MVSVRIQMPLLLSGLGQVPTDLTVEADTLGGALRALVAAYPAVGVHLFDESGGLREHVLCLWNGANSRWFEDLEQPLAAGDTVTILQAVSGG